MFDSIDAALTVLALDTLKKNLLEGFCDLEGAPYAGKL
jgi:hypothetical protein